MASQGPIIILEDDEDDISILEQAFIRLEVPNLRHYYNDGRKVLDFLRTTREQPFVILSGVKLPGMHGLELREQIQADDHLRKKGIPFVFLSQDVRREVVNRAYDLTVQGFFEKADTVNGVEQQLKSILNYWRFCRHPHP